MCKCRKKKQAKKGTDTIETGTLVTVNVTKIVKYIAFAGVLIVGIIFGTGAYIKKLEKEQETKEE